MPHIVSTDKQFAVIKKGEAVEKQTQAVVDHIRYEASHIVYLEEGLDPTDSIKQMGKPFTSTEFERRLAPLLPSSFTFIDNPFIPDKKAIIRIKNKNDVNIGSYETICAYEKGILPEHSVMQLVTTEVADEDVLLRRKKLDRKDLPKYEYKPGVGYIFDDTATRLGFKKIKQVGRELKRGWRTVLIKLLMGNYVTLQEIERTFGTDETPNWAIHAHGRKDYNLPW